MDILGERGSKGEQTTLSNIFYSQVKWASERSRKRATPQHRDIRNLRKEGLITIEQALYELEVDYGICKHRGTVDRWRAHKPPILPASVDLPRLNFSVKGGARKLYPHPELVWELAVVDRMLDDGFKLQQIAEARGESLDILESAESADLSRISKHQESMAPMDRAISSWIQHYLAIQGGARGDDNAKVTFDGTHLIGESADRPRLILSARPIMAQSHLSGQLSIKRK